MDFSSSVDWALSKARAVAKPDGTVTVCNGINSVELATAGMGESRFELMSEEILLDEHQTVDFIVDPSELNFGAGAVEPKDGWTITVDDGSTVAKYEIMPAGGEAAWRWTDRYRTNYRIHTKRINEADA